MDLNFRGFHGSPILLIFKCRVKILSQKHYENAYIKLSYLLKPQNFKPSKLATFKEIDVSKTQY